MNTNYGEALGDQLEALQGDGTKDEDLLYHILILHLAALVRILVPACTRVPV